MSNTSIICASTINEIDSLFRGKNRDLAPKMIELIYKFERYWPMTLRAFYYQAVSALLIPNEQKQYRKIGEILKVLRRNDLIPWYSMEDKTRSTSDKRGQEDVFAYIEAHLKQFLSPDYYQRCYIQKQPVYVEISVEKDALSNHVKEAAWIYCTRVTVTRGQPSATIMNELAQRFDKAIMRDLKPILLHFGDLDPTGVQIPKSMKHILLEYHGIDVDVRQVGLTPFQCTEYKLPQTFDAAKKSDPNIKKWNARYGLQSPTELDALHPEILKKLVVDSLNGIYDVNEINEQQTKEQEDRDLLKSMRMKSINFLRSEFPEYMNSCMPF